MSVNPGDQIGTCECPSCGATVPLKVSKNKTIYVYCRAPVETDDNGKVLERCYYRTGWGRKASRDMIEQFEKGQKDHENHNREPAGEQPGAEPVAEPAGQPEPAPGDAGKPARSGIDSIFGF